MRSVLAATAAILISLFSLTPAKAQGIDVQAANENLIRSVTEDYERQRMRQRAREDAEDALDLSQFEALAAPPLPRPAHRSGGMTCITTGLGDGDSITNCR
jgi:hypothetical protein